MSQFYTGDMPYPSLTDDYNKHGTYYYTRSLL